MAPATSYIQFPTSDLDLPRLKPSSPERAKALIRVIETAIHKGDITFNMDNFTACSNPQHTVNNHSLTVGLGEQWDKDKDSETTFGKLSLTLCRTQYCSRTKKYVLHAWTVDERCTLFPPYVDWLIKVGDRKGLCLMKNNIVDILDADNPGNSDPNFNELDLHILHTIQGLPKSSSHTPSSTPCNHPGNA
ncbi:hypothetical protein GYMLUDRAFT_56019 [Collybiopsis luxurians FD-317 M1]|nr:hypothetical protein GYMLUDRAFT_56019 [Collybiopsis luxurians FD-317 M1]